MVAITATKGAQYLGAIAIMAAASLLALTNPNQMAYGKFAAEQASNLVLQDLCRARQDDSEDILARTWGNSCDAISKNGAVEIEQFITHNTQRQNLVVCSLYTTELPLHSLKVLGISNHFVVLSLDSSARLNFNLSLAQERPPSLPPANHR